MTECSMSFLGQVIRMALDCVNWNHQNSTHVLSQDQENFSPHGLDYISHVSPSQFNQDSGYSNTSRPRQIESRLIPLESEPPKVFQVKNLSDGYSQEIGRIFMIFPMKLMEPMIIMTQESSGNSIESIPNRNVYSFINEEERRQFVTTVYHVMNNSKEERHDTKKYLFHLRKEIIPI